MRAAIYYGAVPVTDQALAAWENYQLFGDIFSHSNLAGSLQPQLQRRAIAWIATGRSRCFTALGGVVFAKVHTANDLNIRFAKTENSIGAFLLQAALLQQGDLFYKFCSKITVPERRTT